MMWHQAAREAAERTAAADHSKGGTLFAHGTPGECYVPKESAALEMAQAQVQEGDLCGRPSHTDTIAAGAMEVVGANTMASSSDQVAPILQ